MPNQLQGTDWHECEILSPDPAPGSIQPDLHPHGSCVPGVSLWDRHVPVTLSSSTRGGGRLCQPYDKNPSVLPGQREPAPEQCCAKDTSPASPWMMRLALSVMGSQLRVKSNLRNKAALGDESPLLPNVNAFPLQKAC